MIHFSWHQSVPSANWGDVPGWIQAVAALLALIGAAVAVQQSWKVLALERQRDAAEASRARQLEEDQAAAQARLVSAWSDRKTGDRLTILVANRSELPVYQMRVIVLFQDGEPLTVEEDVVPPKGEPHPLEVLRDWAPNRVQIAFIDAGGRGWKRDVNGLLARVEE